MITLITSNTNKDVALEIILKEVESRMSEKILIYVYGSMMIDDKDTDECHVVQWIKEPYIL